jgi:tripartite-type tricarboxylate transporter receptor subunit TctC
VIESGYPGYDVSVWWGVVGPRGVPAGIHDKLRREFVAVLQDPDTTKKLATDSAEPINLAPPEFRKLIQSELKKWSVVAKEAKIRVE